MKKRGERAFVKGKELFLVVTLMNKRAREPKREVEREERRKRSKTSNVSSSTSSTTRDPQHLGSHDGGGPRRTGTGPARTHPGQRHHLVEAGEVDDVLRRRERRNGTSSSPPLPHSTETRVRQRSRNATSTPTTTASPPHAGREGAPPVQLAS